MLKNKLNINNILIRVEPKGTHSEQTSEQALFSLFSMLFSPCLLSTFFWYSPPFLTLVYKRVRFWAVLTPNSAFLSLLATIGNFYRLRF
jgi:hypothetical protein